MFTFSVMEYHDLRCDKVGSVCSSSFVALGFHHKIIRKENGGELLRFFVSNLDNTLSLGLKTHW